MENRRSEDRFYENIMEQFAELKTAIALLSQRVENSNIANEHSHKNMKMGIDNHELTLHGNNDQPGLVIKVDRIERLEENRTVHRGIIYTVLTTLSLHELWNLFIKKPN